MKRPFHMMAKPTSYQCNIKCDYCFYLEKKHRVQDEGQPVQRHMNDAVLQSYIQQYIATCPGDQVEFTWQGGEPTTAGLPFYRKVIALQKRFAQGKTITNSMQTNGVLINEEWAAFLAEHQFLMGISLDGPRHLHDTYRKSTAGRSVFDQVINAIRLFQRYNIDYNVLCVVNNETAQAPLEIYQFITQQLGARFVQFIPIVEQRSATSKWGELIYPHSPDSKTLTSWSVSGADYGTFITTIFDYWVRHDVGEVYVQLFDNALAAWAGETPSLCVMQKTCGSGLVIEQNGDIYSCDHYVYPHYRLGNLQETPLGKLAWSKQQQKFGQQKANVSSLCQQCEYRFACHGGCPKHRIQRVGSHWHNHLCDGYRKIFAHLDPYMRFMARQLHHQQPPAAIMRYVDQIGGTSVLFRQPL